MKNINPFLQSFLCALGVLIYVSTIAILGFNSQAIFGGESSFLIPIMMLLLFVVSATITGGLVLGKPIILYWDGLKKEAFVFFFSTLAWLVIFLSLVMIFLLIK